MSDNKKYMVLSNDGIHEYIITVEDTEKGEKFSLFHSFGEQWSISAKGKLILSMTNTGNCVVFDRKLKKLDYAELFYIRLLVNFEHSTDTNPVNREKYRIIEDKSIIEL